MSRAAQGWRVILRPGESNYRAVFTAHGKQRKPSTGIRAGEPGAAERAAAVAARLYTDALTAGPAASRAAAAPQSPRDRPIADAGAARGGVARSLVPACAAWLAEATGSTVRAPTAAAYGLAVRAHLAPFFDARGGLDGVTRDSTAEYIRTRLRSVKAKTVRKELTALRGLLAASGHDDPDALIAPIPRAAKGTANARGKRTATPLTHAEAMAILRRLPARDRFGQVMRLRYLIAYEMTHRPATLGAVSVPDNWTAGQSYILIRDELDKTGFGRRVELSRAARLALHLVTDGGRRRGPVFDGTPDHRDSLKKAARAVLGERGATFHSYDLRRNGITRVIAETPDDALRAAQWIAGHKRISTTAIYAQESEAAGRAAMAARRGFRAAVLDADLPRAARRSRIPQDSRGAKGGT